MLGTQPKVLGRILVHEHFCAPMEVFHAVAVQSAGDQRGIGEILVENGCLTTVTLEEALVIQRQEGDDEPIP